MESATDEAVEAAALAAAFGGFDFTGYKRTSGRAAKRPSARFTTPGQGMPPDVDGWAMAGGGNRS